MLVALTGWSDPKIAARAQAEGFAHFFVKPFDPFGVEALLAAAG
jgi:AmiR/NasT family two-component response regulator